MFDFLFHNKNKEVESYLEIIKANTTKLQLSRFAIEKAAGMIANAIAKSEFVVQREKGRVKDEVYWRLNIQPNDNETGTDFWRTAIRELLTTQECAICFLQGKFYIIDSYQMSDNVMSPAVYTNVTIKCNDDTLQLRRTLTSDEVMHFRTKGSQKKKYLESVVKIYDDTLNAICEMEKMASMPKFSLNKEANFAMRRKKQDGSDVEITEDVYKAELKSLIESDDIAIISQSANLKLEQLKIESKTTIEDIRKMSEIIHAECAMAFDIPKTAFMGEITEKSDATNEFITYAVMPISETINDAMNAKLVGAQAFMAGERIWVDLSRYKHVDLVESAPNLDKLRAIGFNFDEVRQAVGWEELNTEFSQERVITKNYTNELGEQAKDEGGEKNNEGNNEP